MQVLRKPFPGIFATFIRWTESFFAALWHFIGWMWETIIIGGLLAGTLGNAFYTYLTTGQVARIDLLHLPLLQTISMHPFLATLVLLFLASVTLASSLAHRHQRHTASTATQSEYTLQQVKRLEPQNYKLFRYIAQAYIARDVYSA